MSTNIFLADLEAAPESADQPREPNIFLADLEGMPPAPEGFGKKAVRTAVQAPLGLLKKFRASYIPDLLKGAVEGASQNVLAELGEEDPSLRPGTEGYKQAQEAMGSLSKYMPTQGLLEEVLEEKTGAPLAPKTPLQKALRMGGEAAGFRPGSLGHKATAGVVTPALEKLLEMVDLPGTQGAKIPEIYRQTAAFAGGQMTPAPKLTKEVHPSGIIKRRFEDIEKPTKVSPGKYQKIVESVEGDVKQIAEDLLKEEPLTKEAIEDPTYQEKLDESLAQVSEKAKEIPFSFKPKQLLSFMKRRLKNWQKDLKGVSLSESEKTFVEEFQNIMTDIAEGRGQYTFKDLVDQYRKFNKSLGEYFDPSKPKSANQGKRNALLEANRSIAEFFDTVAPGSEFSKLFKDTNKRYARKADVDLVSDTLDGIFEGGKIDFKAVDKLLDPSRTNLRRSFQNSMGKEGFAHFEKGLRDVMGMKNPMGLLKKAESAGFGKLASLAGSYLMHPSLAKLKIGYDLAKDLPNMFLDKPQLAVKWERAVDGFKKGKFQEAQDNFEKLDSEMHKTAEKAKSLGERGRVLPEGFEEAKIAEKATEKMPGEKESYYLFPSKAEISSFKLKDKPLPIHPHDINMLSGKPRPENLSKNIMFKNSWDQLMKRDKFKEYYDFKGETKKIGKVGDFIKNENLRRIYKDVLDTPVNIKKGNENYFRRSEKEITLSDNLTPHLFYSNLIHETHHALQNKYRPEGSLYKKESYWKKQYGRGRYLKHHVEAKARMAERYAAKDLIKARKAAMKTKEKSPVSRPISVDVPEP